MNGKVWIGAFTVFAVLVIVFAIIIPMMRENSVLGHGNPTKQKLMVIDQDTGAISFVTKSLQGINDNFTQHDDRVLNALTMLLGDNLDNFGGYETQRTVGSGVGVAAMMVRDMQATDRRAKQVMGDDYGINSSGLAVVDKNRVKHSGNNGILANVIKRVEAIDIALEAKIATKIGAGESIGISTKHTNTSSSRFWLGDELCTGNPQGSTWTHTGWCNESRSGVGGVNYAAGNVKNHESKDHRMQIWRADGF